jgi:hypothetical protein
MRAHLYLHDPMATKHGCHPQGFRWGCGEDMHGYEWVGLGWDQMPWQVGSSCCALLYSPCHVSICVFICISILKMIYQHNLVGRVVVGFHNTI